MNPVADKKIALGQENELPMKATLHDDGTATVELAIGSAVPWHQKESSSIYFSDTPLMRTGIIPNDFHSIIPILRWYYTNDAMFGTIIDTMVELAIDNTIKNTTDDKKVQEFFDGIVETSNLKKACRWIILEYFLLNNVFTYRTRHEGTVKSRNGTKVPQYEWTVLNPEYTHVTGSLLFGEPQITLKPDNSLDDLLNASDKGIIPSILPNDIRKNWGKDAIQLDPDNVYHIGRHKQPYQRYAPVTLKRVLRPLKMKEIYMKMDISTANSVINQIVVFKLGSDKFPIRDQSVLDKFSQMITTNSKAYQLVWTHALEIDYVRADAEALDSKKYDFVNRELLYGFAVPPTLIGQTAGTGNSNAYLAVKGMVERLAWAREDLEDWIEREYRIIAKENNLKTWAKPHVGSVNLEEEKTFRQILLSLHQHGVLSAETLLSETGFDILTEVERLKLEKEIRDSEGILIPSSPYQKSKYDSTPEGVAPVTSPGRPLDSPDSEDRDSRDPNPKPMGSGMVMGSEEAKKYLLDEADLYFLKISALYAVLESRILEIAKEQGIDESLVVAAIFAFFEEMKKTGDATFSRVSEASYTDVHNHTPDSNSYNEYLNKVIEWNDMYLKKLCDSLEEQLLELTSFDVDDYLPLINKVLEKERYRLRLFATEGVKKANASGIISSHIDLGYDQARWICQFRNPCEVCVERHDQIFSIEDVFEIYPAHIHCECELEFVNSSRS